ncbi:MAG: TonB-dependent receptor [Acidobacteriaceae bacterium]|nr:TonB-dependent receptor [Acidobacteriaceae bacterium]
MAALLSVLVAGSARGQALQGINGTVTDATGATVPNATVTATNDQTSVSKISVTSSAGTYEFNDLIPGTYTVKIEAQGFERSVHSGVGVSVARISTVNATLQPGRTEQTVNVTESVIAIDTTQPELGTTLENKVVQELPNEISGGRGRQIDNFIFLAPGVTGSTFSHRINGGVDFESEVIFNGIPMAQSETQGFQTIWNPPFELVNQYDVLRSSFSAQYGLAQGVVTYNTKSGTNTYHGDGFEIIRNNFFDAKGAYNPTVPIDKENNYGFTLTGPIWIPKVYNGKNRTFFTVVFEWYRQNQTQTNFVSLPTSAEKSGDFSGLGTPIWNPANSGCSANGNTPGTQFRNNVIPAICFSPLSASLLQYFPNPSSPGVHNNQQTLLGVFPTRQEPWGVTIDHSISDKQSIHWTEWRDPQTSFATENNATGLPVTNPLTSVTSNPDLGSVFILNYANAVTPHLVVTAGASWLGELNDQISQRPNNIALSAAPGAPQVPAIEFNGPNSPTTVGSPWIESINRKLGIVIENNWQWVKGKQTFNIGGEVRRTYQDDNECQQCAGIFQFSNNETANPANLSNTGNSFASFLLGTVDSADRIGSQEERLRNKDFSLYVQDDIKWTPRLTLNFGVRWDIMVPFTAVNNPIVYFDSTLPDPAADGRLGAATKFGDCAGCADITRAAIHWGHVSPRFGYSYEMNTKTVLQGGFSMNFLDGGAYEYGTAKVAVNYGNLLVGSFSAPSTGSTSPGFGSWDSNVLPFPSPVPFSNGLGTGTFINAFNPAVDGWAPYDLVWNIGLQRELPYDMFLSAAYTGNRANRLPSQLNPINQLPPQFLAQYGASLGLPYATAGPALGIPLPFANFLTVEPNATVLQALRPYPQFQGSYGGIFNNFDDTGSSMYDAMQLSLEKRYTNGLSFLVSYNLSRMMSDTNSGFTSFAALALNKDNQKAEWSIDNNDQTNMLNIAGTYELPFGKGRAFMNRGGVLNAVLGGWQISPLLSYATGTPLWNGSNSGGSVYVTGDPLGNECTPCNRANVVSYNNIMLSYNNVYKGLSVINKADFSDPGPWALGNAPRVIGALRNQFQSNENIALAKYFPIGERVKLKLEIEYFNVLNRVLFSGPNCGPDLNFEDSTFGQSINCQSNTQRQGQAFLGINF